VGNSFATKRGRTVREGDAAKRAVIQATMKDIYRTFQMAFREGRLKKILGNGLPWKIAPCESQPQGQKGDHSTKCKKGESKKWVHG